VPSDRAVTVPAIGPDVHALRAHLVDAHWWEVGEAEHESTSALTAAHDGEHERENVLDHVHAECDS
jgi:hypothetical protein